MENPGLENTSQEMFIGTDKISEIVNDLDSDGGSLNELSDRDMCKINLPCCCSSSSSSGGGSCHHHLS
jgi:hypothetical protein